MVDTLDPGGMERVAVNLVNVLPRGQFEYLLCTTRRDGALAGLVASDVKRCRLARRSRFDMGAIRRLGSFITSENIQIVHAHGSSVFVALGGALYPPYPAVVWHDHYGLDVASRAALPYRVAALRVAAVLSVNEELAAWARRVLQVAKDRVWYVPNFVRTPRDAGKMLSLPGRAGLRVVCVANLRPQKDHPTLVRAFAQVHDHLPDAHLLLVGAQADPAQLGVVQQTIDHHRLHGHVTLLGFQEDVSSILQHCDVGVLGSIAEGFPLALVEYGLAGLPVVATAVGQCPEILEEGRAGLLTPPRDPERLAEAMLSLLRSPALRHRFGQRLAAHVRSRFSQESVLRQIVQVYDAVAPIRGHDALRRAAS